MPVIRYVPLVVSGPDPVVMIVSSAYASLPAPGNRVGPSDTANMPTIQASGGNPAITTEDGAHHYRLVGLYIRAQSTGFTYNIADIGGGETTLAEFPTDITFDRCVVRGDPTNGARRAIALNAIRGAVVDSYLYDCKEVGADTQAAWAYNTPGPLKIVNNYLEAAGENVMFGGSDPSYANAVPSDIEIRRNYFYKPLSWVGSSWTVKNLLEFKNAQRVLCEGNILENNWAAAQNGFALLVTPRNQDNTAPWCTTRDLTIRYNKLLNVDQGMNLSGRDGNYTSEVTYRLSIEHNLIEVENVNNGDGRVHGITGGPVDLQIIKNTWVIRRSGGTCGFHENYPKAENTIWRDNVFTGGSYGISGTGSGAGDSTFSTWFNNHTYAYNVMYASPGGTYTGTGNQFPAAATDVFTDYANKDYTIKPAYSTDASDGGPPGANITTLDSLTLHCVDGQWGSEPATYTDRSYTNAEMPREYIDTTYAAQAGSVIYCNSGDNLQAKIDSAVPGDTIIVEAGATFTGSFILRNT